MLKKLLITLLSIFCIAGGVFCIVSLIFFITPSRTAQAGISLPAQIEDPASSSVETTEEADDSDTYDNIYLADVHQSLTLRTEPDSDASPVMEEGLAPMTKMQVLEFVEGTSFAHVEVINGTYQGLTGYVNYEYITKLGEPTIRVGYDDGE